MRWKAVAMWGTIAGVYIYFSFTWIMFGGLEPVESLGSLALKVLHALVLGWLIVWMYALMEARWGAGLKPMLCAGIGGWVVNILFAASGIADVGPGPLSGSVLVWTLAELTFAGVLVSIVYDD